MWSSRSHLRGVNVKVFGNLLYLPVTLVKLTIQLVRRRAFRGLQPILQALECAGSIGSGSLATIITFLSSA
jgi:hypothetical protein